MKIILLRHGRTAGNQLKKYIGITDEPLSEYGKEELRSKCYPECDIVFTSCLQRTIQSAEIIFPGKPQICCREFNECNFGRFEGKNYLELSDDPTYQQWIDSNGELPFPDGESRESFKKRCCDKFAGIVGSYSHITPAFVVHGGTIMAILEKYAVPHRQFYDYNVDNGRGYIVDFDGKNIKILEKI